MKRATLTRFETGPEGTFGDLVFEGGAFKCKVVERPWDNNNRGTSGIPKGKYIFKKRTDSPAHGTVYEEWDDPTTPQREDVKDRDNVQIHAANYPDELLGCLAPGLIVARFPKAPGLPVKKGVTSSATALKQLIEFTQWEDIELTVTGVCG